jgi:hypothetical protein
MIVPWSSLWNNFHPYFENNSEHQAAHKLVLEIGPAIYVPFRFGAATGGMAFHGRHLLEPQFFGAD